MACGCSHSSVNKFLGILMSNNKSPGHMENGFLHFDILAFQNTQNMNWNECGRCAYMAIIMNEFLPVPNVAPSSYILLCNNLPYVICVMFFW